MRAAENALTQLATRFCYASFDVPTGMGGDLSTNLSAYTSSFALVIGVLDEARWPHSTFILPGIGRSG
jgi:hypothetical protein